MHKIIAASKFFVFPLHLLKTGYKIAEPCEKKIQFQDSFLCLFCFSSVERRHQPLGCWSVPFHVLKQINSEFEIKKGKEGPCDVKVMQHNLLIEKMFFVPAAVGFSGEGQLGQSSVYSYVLNYYSGPTSWISILHVKAANASCVLLLFVSNFYLAFLFSSSPKYYYVSISNRKYHCYMQHMHSQRWS